MQKISEFLNDYDSHGIYADKGTREDFKAATGLEPSWPCYTVEQLQKEIAKDPRGGVVYGEPTELMVSGYEIADGLAKKYVGYTSPMHGRGFRFRDCIRVLKEKGL